MARYDKIEACGCLGLIIAFAMPIALTLAALHVIKEIALMILTA